MNINEQVMQKLHTIERIPHSSGLNTRWIQARPIKIAILDFGYDPSSKFFRDQEEYGNHGLKDRITWKDFVGEASPEDRHAEKHGTKLLCLMLMLLPTAEIFVGRVAMDENYTESSMFADPLEKVGKLFIKLSEMY